MKTLITLAAGAALGLLFVNAHAADTAPASLTVQFADLDLDRAQAVSALFNRIKAAARQVCEPLDGKLAQQHQQYRTCVSFALQTAVARVDRPQLTDYLASRSSSAAKTPATQLASK